MRTPRKIRRALDSKGMTVMELMLASAIFAIVTPAEVVVTFNGPGAGLKGPSQRNSFLIAGRWAFHIDRTEIDLAKIDRANELIAELQSSANFAGIGMLPLVTRVEPGSGAPAQGFYEVVLRFEVITLASHH